MAVFTSVIDMIGDTPLVDVSMLSPNPDVRILAKIESQNPAGSVKDRIARKMIDEAEADGMLTPGKTIIEPSSGNTGIALAMIAQIKGYPIKIVLPENVSIERRQMLEVFGAEIIHSPGSEGSNGAVRRAIALADEHPDWVFLYQYANEANPRAHYEGTGPEIWRDCPDITHFVAGPRYERHADGCRHLPQGAEPDIKVLAVEPPIGELVEGLRNLDEGYIPPVYEKWGGPELLDGKRIVRPLESIEWTRRLVDRVRIVRRALVGRGAGRRGAGRRADRRPAPSCSSSATAAGSTSRPAPTPTTSTRWPSGRARSSTSDASSSSEADHDFVTQPVQLGGDGRPPMRHDDRRWCGCGIWAEASPTTISPGRSSRNDARAARSGTRRAAPPMSSTRPRTRSNARRR